ncbi:MAG TPA: exodeoxyribonuclease VII large subunit [Candidatus Eremiobacteraceae bacterium]
MRTPLFPAPALTVGELCRAVRGALESAFPDRVRVTGEISKCSVAPSGHAYFSLKDKEGLVACVVWRSTVARLDVAFPLADGAAVEVSGRLNIYKERSQFQLTVDDVVPQGRGAMHRLYELLKEKLRREGLFDEARKRPIPEFVSKVAIVTSRGSAALQDFITTCRRRGGHVAITVVHAPVQGESAVPELAIAIARAGRLPVDVVVVARGGGSIEDLWAFNAEVVARAIVACARPVISAIGHETDFTIADFVADKRAATPTAAAELVTADRFGLLRRIAQLDARLGRSFARAVAHARFRWGQALDALVRAPDTFIGAAAQTVDDLAAGVRRGDPRRRLAEGRRRIADALFRARALGPRAIEQARSRSGTAHEKLTGSFNRVVTARRNAFDINNARLVTLGPRATLARGYAIVHDARDRVISDAAVTSAGERIGVTLRRGGLTATVVTIEETHDEA